MKKAITACFLFVFLSGALREHLTAATLNLKLYLQGYYVGSGFMRPVLRCAYPGNSTLCDTVLVELRNPASRNSLVASCQGVLKTNGTISCTIPNSLIGQQYYIAIKHRNTIETWSATRVTIKIVTNYNFSSAASQAYNNNMVKVDNTLNLWAFYTGDLNQDGKINSTDYNIIFAAASNAHFGCQDSDLNGDGNVDLLDFYPLDANINAGIISWHP